MPTVAVKLNEALPLSASVEFMHASFTMGQQLPCLIFDITQSPQVSRAEDIMMTLDGSDWGIGVQLDMHLRLNDKLSLGLTYKNGVSLDVDGSAGFSRVEDNLFAKEGQLPRTEPTGVHGKIRLPDSLALGLVFYPTDNLSFELGTVLTRWSTYKSLNVSFDSGYNLNEAKNWRDG